MMCGWQGGISYVESAMRKVVAVRNGAILVDVAMIDHDFQAGNFPFSNNGKRQLIAFNCVTDAVCILQN